MSHDDLPRDPQDNGTTTSTTVVEERPAVRPSNDVPPVTDDPKAKPQRHGWWPMLAAALALGFAGGVAGFAVSDQVRGDDTTSAQAPLAPSNEAAGDDEEATPASNDDGDALTPNQIYRNVAPAVVHVTAKTRQVENSFFGIPQEREGEGSGSGFVIDQDGHIITNAHVVENASSVSVSFSNDKEYKAEIVGEDVSSDVAVLKVDAGNDELRNALKTVPYADSSKVTVGDPVLAIGNPFNLDRTLTTGVVSALQRQIQAPNGFAIDDVIQTDAAINPGNSGGPLLDTRGRVIGINSQINSRSGGNEGIGFAIPSNTVKRIADQLIKDGSVDHAWLGVTGAAVDDTLAALINLPVKEGVLVGEVADGSPAEKAGLKGGTREVIIDGMNYRLGGDIITKVDGESLDSMRELADYINRKGPGDEVELELYRGDKRVTEEIELGTRPTTQAGGSRSRSQR